MTMLRFLKIVLNDIWYIKHLTICVILVAFTKSGYGQKPPSQFWTDVYLFPNDRSEDFSKLATRETDSIRAFLYRQSADFVESMKTQDEGTCENGCWKFVDLIARDSQTYMQPVILR